MRRTKIVCTIGPASSSPDVLRRLIHTGMNVARLNFSHGTHEEHGRVIATIRQIAGELGVPVAILQDLQGRKIRLGKFREARHIWPARNFRSPRGRWRDGGSGRRHVRRPPADEVR
jgi:pyruvate kinase